MTRGYRDVFPAALSLEGRAVLVLGGDDEAEQKTEKLLRARARVTLVSTEATARLAERSRRGELDWFARDLLPTDLAGKHLVVLCDRDPSRARALRSQRAQHGYWLCAVDQPEFSDLFLVSTVMRGPVQIGISTGGGAPLLARRLRQALEAALDTRFVEFASVLAQARAALGHLPKKERRDRVRALLTGFAMQVHVSYPDADMGADREA